jgi:uncharacterized membrane protein YhaH (DUF805 family)
MSDFGSRLKRIATIAMHPRHRFSLSELADPRGRCNRKAFLVVAIGLLICQVALAVILSITGIGLSGGEAFILNAPLCWLGLSACIQRLHDLNKSAWIVPAAVFGWLTVACLVTLGVVMIGAQLTGGEDVLAEGSYSYMIMFSLISIPAFGGMLWLHAAPGDLAANRYGTAPGRNGFGAATRRVVPARAEAKACKNASKDLGFQDAALA